MKAVKISLIDRDDWEIISEDFRLSNLTYDSFVEKKEFVIYPDNDHDDIEDVREIAEDVCNYCLDKFKISIIEVDDED